MWKIAFLVKRLGDALLFIKTNNITKANKVRKKSSSIAGTSIKSTIEGIKLLNNTIM